MFRTDSGLITLATWVDNLFSAADSAGNAIKVLSDLEDTLRCRWKLDLGKTSSLYMVCEGGEVGNCEGWKHTDQFLVLGHTLSRNGSTRPCWEKTRRAMWTSFWSNAGALSSKAPLAKKLCLLKRSTLPRLEYVLPRWLLAPQRAKELNHIQARMISLLLRLPKDSGEDKKM